MGPLRSVGSGLQAFDGGSSCLLLQHGGRPGWFCALFGLLSTVTCLAGMTGRGGRAVPFVESQFLLPTSPTRATSKVSEMADV